MPVRESVNTGLNIQRRGVVLESQIASATQFRFSSRVKI